MANAGMTVQEAGRKGGQSTSERYGHDFYEAIGHMGARALAKKYGHEHFVAIGHKGGQQSRRVYAAGRAALGTASKE